MSEQDFEVVGKLFAEAYALGQQRADTAAEEKGIEALEVARVTFGEDSHEFLETRLELAYLFHYIEYDDAAEREYHAILDTLLPSHDPLIEQTFAGLAFIAENHDHLSSADSLYSRCLSRIPVNDPSGFPLIRSLARVREKQAFNDSAEGLFRHALAEAEKIVGRMHPEYAEGVEHLAGFLLRQGRSAESLSLWVRRVEYELDTLLVETKQQGLSKDMDNLMSLQEWIDVLITLLLPMQKNAEGANEAMLSMTMDEVLACIQYFKQTERELLGYITEADKALAEDTQVLTEAESAFPIYIPQPQGQLTNRYLSLPLQSTNGRVIEFLRYHRLEPTVDDQGVGFNWLPAHYGAFVGIPNAKEPGREKVRFIDLGLAAPYEVTDDELTSFVSDTVTPGVFPTIQ